MVDKPITFNDFKYLKELLTRQGFEPTKVLVDFTTWNSLNGPVGFIYYAILKAGATVVNTTRDGNAVIVEIDFMDTDHTDTIILWPKEKTHG